MLSARSPSRVSCAGSLAAPPPGGASPDRATHTPAPGDPMRGRRACGKRHNGTKNRHPPAHQPRKRAKIANFPQKTFWAAAGSPGASGAQDFRPPPRSRFLASSDPASGLITALSGTPLAQANKTLLPRCAPPGRDGESGRKSFSLTGLWTRTPTRRFSLRK